MNTCVPFYKVVNCVVLGAHDSKFVPNPYLTIGEEEEPVRFLDVHCRIGYPYIQKHVLSIVKEVVNYRVSRPKFPVGVGKPFLDDTLH